MIHGRWSWGSQASKQPKKKSGRIHREAEPSGDANKINSSVVHLPLHQTQTITPQPPPVLVAQSGTSQTIKQMEQTIGWHD
jgi:hypothetical protein